MLADGQRIPLEGTTKVTLKLGNEVFVTNFIIAEIDNHILLGFDFFKNFNCQIDFKNNQLVCQGQKIDCCAANGEPLQVKVQAKYTTSIPPRSEKLVQARLNRVWRHGAACIEHTGGLPGLVVASSIHQPKNQDVCIRIMNYSDAEIELKSGQVIASCSIVGAVEDNPNMGPTNGALPEDLENAFQQWCHRLDDDQVKRAMGLLQKNQSIFSTGKYDLGRTAVVQHTIPLVRDARPIKQRPYRHGPVQEAEIEKQVQELKEHGLVKEGHGAWSSPVVLVKKKDGSWRFCVDYRKLNELTTKDAYPLPRIDDSLDALGGSKWFSTLDLASGYWQVELESSAKEAAAFTTRSGLWEWQVLPFGLTSAPSTFERLMETVLRGLHWRTLLIYLDDIIVFSADFDTHLERLEEVFHRLQAAGLKLKPSKCTLFGERVHYLGHVVSADGVETDATKIEAVSEWPLPKHKSDVRAFLGTCGYYRRFIANYAELSRPLSQLCSTRAEFCWDNECQHAFQTLKNHLTTAPVLAYPDYSKPFILDTDASQVASGAVLAQEQDGQERVIAYYSKMHSPEEANYCVTRLELLAIVKALKHFRPQLYGRRFEIRTDHASLPWLLRASTPTGQLARWFEVLSEFEFTLKHRKGLKHNNADGLSRQICQDCKQCQRYLVPEASQMQPVRIDAVSTHLAGQQIDLAKAQELDEHIGDVYHGVREQKPPSDRYLGWQAEKLVKLWEHLKLDESGVLHVELPYQSRRVSRVICPRVKQAEVTQTAHQSAHLGFNKTLAIIRQNWFWPGMTSYVRKWVNGCVACQKAKPARHRHSDPQNKLGAGRPWQVIAVDLCGPLPETTDGNTQILVLADHFTRWYDAIPIRDGQASTVAKVLDERVFSYFGIPETIHTDQGAQFESALFRACCELWNCKKTRCAPYHPQGNSIVERLNRTLGNSLRAMLAESEHQEWDRLVPQIMRIIRATPHRSTGETPNSLMLGRNVRLPHDLLVNYPTGLDFTEDEYAAQLQKDMQTAYIKLRQHQKCKPRTDDSEEEPKFVKGDQIWLKSYFKTKGRGTKLQPKYVGPYRITKSLPYQTYEMERNGKLSVQHEGRIKLYQEAGTSAPPGENARARRPSFVGSAEDVATSFEPEPPAAETSVKPTNPDVKQRPSRVSKKPTHLQNYWLNKMQTDNDKLSAILGQNSALGGDSVIKKVDDNYDTEFPPLSSQNKTLKTEMIALKRAEVVGETTGTQKSILTGSPRGSLSSPIGSTDGRMVLDPTSCL